MFYVLLAKYKHCDESWSGTETKHMNNTDVVLDICKKHRCDHKTLMLYSIYVNSIDVITNCSTTPTSYLVSVSSHAKQPFFVPQNKLNGRLFSGLARDGTDRRADSQFV